MKKLGLTLTILTVLTLIATACNPSPVGPQNPGGGGFAEISFNVIDEQRFQIALTASNPNIQPYGSLQYPDGTSLYNPPLNTAANGMNRVEIILQSGQYSLTVFDGSNQGGMVSVTITSIPSEQPQSGQPQPGASGPTAMDGIGDAPLEPVLFDQSVMVPGGGGFTEISFIVSNEQRILIVLTASSPAMQPYGSLQYPDGTSLDNPPINTTANGMNRVEIILNQSGQYSLTVFDGSNQGGMVSVKITGIP
jgi:DNA-binding protein YbaB